MLRHLGAGRRCHELSTAARLLGAGWAGAAVGPAAACPSASIHSTAVLCIRRQRGAKSRIAERLEARGEQIPLSAFQIVKGDLVKVIAGKDKGQNGRVKRVIRSENRLIVEGLNLHKKHVKGIVDGDGGIIREGGIFEREAPIHYSNVMLCHPENENVATRFRIGFTKDGKRVRVATTPPRACRLACSHKFARTVR